jgi:hypothetical protein
MIQKNMYTDSNIRVSNFLVPDDAGQFYPCIILVSSSIWSRSLGIWLSPQTINSFMNSSQPIDHTYIFFAFPPPVPVSILNHITKNRWLNNSSAFSCIYASLPFPHMELDSEFLWYPDLPKLDQQKIIVSVVCLWESEKSGYSSCFYRILHQTEKSNYCTTFLLSRYQGIESSLLMVGQPSRLISHGVKKASSSIQYHQSHCCIYWIADRFGIRYVRFNVRNPLLEVCQSSWQTQNQMIRRDRDRCAS